MPLFAYICRKCGTQSELLVRTDAKVKCPQCGSSKMERQMSRFAPLSNHPPASACAAGGCAMAEQGSCPSQGSCMS